MNQDKYSALRSDVALIDTAEAHTLFRISGTDVVTLLDYVIPGRVLSIKPWSGIACLILGCEGEVRDIGHLLNLGDSYLLMGTRRQKERISALLRSHQGNLDVTVENLDDRWTQFHVEGPYSWRVAKQIVGDEILGLKIHHFFDLQADVANGLCYRTTMTGEYGYRFLGPQVQISTLKGKFLEMVPSEFKDDDVETLMLMAHETRCPLMDLAVQEGASPFEMGIRYMIDFRKSGFAYADRLAQRHLETHDEWVAFTLAEGVQVSGATLLGEKVYTGSTPVGTVAVHFWSPDTKREAGYLRLESAWAYPGIPGLTIRRETGESWEAMSVSSPILRTRSYDVEME